MEQVDWYLVNYRYKVKGPLSVIDIKTTMKILTMDQLVNLPDTSHDGFIEILFCQKL